MSSGALVALGLLLALQIPIMPIMVLGPNLPQLFAQFGAMPQADLLVPMIITAPSLGITVLAPAAGIIADRLGHRRLLLGALALFAAAGLLPMLLRSLMAIVAAQLAVGVAAAAIMTSANTLLGDYFPPAARNRWLGVQSELGPFFSAAVSLSAGALGTLGWREPFALNALAAIALAWLALAARRQTSALPGGTEGRAAEASARMPWRRMQPVFAVTVITALVFYVPTIHFGLMYDRLGVHSPALISLLITLGTAGSIAAGYLFRKRPAGPASNLCLLYACFAASLIGYGLAGHYLLGLACGVLANFAFGLTLPTLVSWTLSVLPPAYRGRGMGLWMSAFFCAQFISPPLFALLMRAAGGLAAALVWVGALCVLLAAAAFIASRIERQPAVDPSEGSKST